MKKRIPSFDSDEEARAFTDSADLTQYDLSGGRTMQFEFQAKAAHLNMRIPQPLLDAVKERARVSGMPYTRFIRQLMEREISQPTKPQR